MLTRIRREDRGYVLVVVMLSMILVLSLITGVMSYAVGSRDLSARDQDWNASLAAAEAGIDDYLFRLNQDSSYWLYGDPGVAPTDPKYGAAPPDGNDAFTDWVQVPGDDSDAWYRYDRVGRPDQTGNGTAVLSSTGRVGNVTRTVQTTIRRRNFLDFLYFTDLETTDPALYPTNQNPNDSAWAGLHQCDQRYYEGRDIPGRDDSDPTAVPPFVDSSDADTDDYCTEISFTSNDVINGPLHSNDAIRINGNPRFNGDTSDSWDDPAGVRWWGSGSPIFLPGDPDYSGILPLPPTNQAIKTETDLAAGGTGCLFTGPTAIRLNADGTMDVISPFSQAINCTWTQNPTGSLYQRFSVTRFTLPTTGGVIYVQNVPATLGDPNYTAGGCIAAFSRPAVGGNSGSGTTPVRQHPLGFPQKNDITPQFAGTLQNGYGCLNGDVFLEGTLKGRLTIAADNNIVVVGNTTYQNASADLLGLIANNYVEVYHPVSDPSDTIDGTNEVQTISLSGWGSGDSFRLRFNGSSSSSSITYPTSASAIQTRLVGLSTIDTGDVSVTGSGSGPYTVTFGGQYLNTDVPQITVGSSSGVTVTINTIQNGGNSTAACDGATVNNGCSLRRPTLSSSSTPSLFTSTGSGATVTMSTSTGGSSTSFRSPVIKAAILTVQHSFRVQHYQYGPDCEAGTLNMTGAIAQKYRGIVGLGPNACVSGGGSGYLKNYMYDQRLKYDSPPKFLNPVASAWQVVTWAEQPGDYPAA
jgi:hypothetical protein